MGSDEPQTPLQPNPTRVGRSGQLRSANQTKKKCCKPKAMKCTGTPPYTRAGTLASTNGGGRRRGTASPLFTTPHASPLPGDGNTCTTDRWRTEALFQRCFRAIEIMRRCATGPRSVTPLTHLTDYIFVMVKVQSWANQLVWLG